jgi:hypothetical protein
MSQPNGSTPDLTSPRDELSRTGPVGRVLAFIGGVLALVAGAAGSFGIVIMAPIGMGLVALVQHRRGRRTTRWGSWIAATLSVTAALGVIAIVVYSKVPTPVWRQAMHTADSAQAASAKQPPPAWIQRMAPGMAQQPKTSPKVQSALMAGGIGMAIAFFATFFGTLGWAAGLLFGFAISGRWAGAQAVSGMRTDTA